MRQVRKRKMWSIFIVSALVGALIGVTLSSPQRGAECGAICCFDFPWDPTLCQDCCDPCCASEADGIGFRECLTVCYGTCLNCPSPPPYPASKE